MVRPPHTSLQQSTTWSHASCVEALRKAELRRIPALRAATSAATDL